MLKEVKDIRLFSPSDHSDHMETGRSFRSLGSPGSLNQIFSDSGDPSDPSDYMETGLKNSGENEGRLAHQMPPVQLSSEKKSSF